MNYDNELARMHARYERETEQPGEGETVILHTERDGVEVALECIAGETSGIVVSRVVYMPDGGARDEMVIGGDWYELTPAEIDAVWELAADKADWRRDYEEAGL